MLVITSYVLTLDTTSLSTWPIARTSERTTPYRVPVIVQLAGASAAVAPVVVIVTLRGCARMTAMPAARRSAAVYVVGAAIEAVAALRPASDAASEPAPNVITFAAGAVKSR